MWEHITGKQFHVLFNSLDILILSAYTNSIKILKKFAVYKNTLWFTVKNILLDRVDVLMLSAYPNSLIILRSLLYIGINILWYAVALSSVNIPFDKVHYSWDVFSAQKLHEHIPGWLQWAWMRPGFFWLGLQHKVKDGCGFLWSFGERN